MDAYDSAWTSAPDNGLAACVSNSSDPTWPSCNVQRIYDATTLWPIGIAADAAVGWNWASPQNLRYELKEITKRWRPKKIVIVTCLS